MAVKLGGHKTDYSAMQGPAPSGFHVPLRDEWIALCLILTSTFGMASNATTMGTYLKMPMAGYRYSSSSNVGSLGSLGRYWSSMTYSAGNAYCLRFNSSSLNSQYGGVCAEGQSVRCFKDTPVTPDSSWTEIFRLSGTPQGMYVGVYHNSSLGLISVSGDGIIWYTIQDKNLGATTVYSQGDTLTDANCGYFYQRGNNYGFAHSGTITTSSTKVDASSYGPGNYYNSSTFITGSTNRSSVQNDNLRGGVTGIKPGELKAAYIGEYVWKPGANTIAYYPLTATTTVNDQSGNNYNLTNGGNITFGDNAGVSCASFNNTSRYLYTSITETSDTNLTFNIWIYLTNNRTTKDTNRIMGATYNLSSTTPPNHFMMQYSDGYPSSTKGLCGSYVKTQWSDIQYTSVDTININTWYNCCVTYDGSNIKLYVNGSLYNTKAFTRGTTNTIKSIYINCRENDISFYGYLSNAIFEKKTRTAEEVAYYYNKIKGTYGL